MHRGTFPTNSVDLRAVVSREHSLETHTQTSFSIIGREILITILSYYIISIFKYVFISKYSLNY